MELMAHAGQGAKRSVPGQRGDPGGFLVDAMEEHGALRQMRRAPGATMHRWELEMPAPMLARDASLVHGCPVNQAETLWNQSCIELAHLSQGRACQQKPGRKEPQRRLRKPWPLPLLEVPMRHGVSSGAAIRSGGRDRVHCLVMAMAGHCSRITCHCPWLPSLHGQSSLAERAGPRPRLRFSIFLLRAPCMCHGCICVACLCTA